MHITTTSFIPGQNVTALLGTLFAEQVTSINVVRDLASWLKGITGGRMDTYVKEYARARSLALAALEDQASAVQADALIDLHVDFNEFVNSDLIIITCAASAVAVKTSSAI